MDCHDLVDDAPGARSWDAYNGEKVELGDPEKGEFYLSKPLRHSHRLIVRLVVFNRSVRHQMSSNEDGTVFSDCEK